MAHVTDYDVWHMTEESVNVDMVVKTLHKNTELAQQTIAKLVANLGDHENCTCNHALENAIITHRQAINDKVIKKLGPLVDKYIH
jgi:5'-methylthioadenosine phosphorylase